MKNGRVFKKTLYITPENTASDMSNAMEKTGLSDNITPKIPQAMVRSPQ